MNVKGTKYAAEPLTQDEVRALLAQIKGKGPLGVRNRALVSLLVGSGARISEALSLYPRDVLADGSLRLRTTKGSKPRVVWLQPEARPLLDAWLEKRAGLGLNGRQPVFCSVASGTKARTPGQPMDPSYVRRLLPQLAEKAGIDKRVHAHGLRHTHATTLLAKRAPLGIISGQLGHASAATTDAYLAKIAPADRLAALDALWSE